MSEALVCDHCGDAVSDRRNDRGWVRLKRVDDLVVDFSDWIGPLNFCGTRCLASWARDDSYSRGDDRPEPPPPQPNPDITRPDEGRMWARRRKKGRR